MMYRAQAAALFIILIISTPSLALDYLRLHVISGKVWHDPSDKSVLNIDLQLTKQSTKEFEDWTRRHVGEVIEILIDGRVVIEPHLVKPLIEGTVQLRGLPTEEAEAVVPKLLIGRSTLAVQARR